MMGETIKALRAKRGLSQGELAQRLHVVRQTVSKWEQNRSVPDAHMLEELARVLEVSVTDLLDSPPPGEQASLEAMTVQLSAIQELLEKQQRRQETFWKWCKRLPAMLLTAYLLLVGFDFLCFKFSDDPYLQYRPWWQNFHWTQSSATYDGYGYFAKYNVSKSGEITGFYFRFLGQEIYAEES